MKAIKRMKQMLSASVNDVLDRAENPRAMVNQMIRDMEEGLAEMRESTVTTIATARTAERKQARTQAAADELEKAIENAVRHGRDDAAREAMRRRKSVMHTLDVLNAEIKEANTLSEKMKREMKLLEAKLREAHVKRDMLVARETAAKTRKKLYDNSDAFSSRMHAAVSNAQQVMDTSSSFGRMEDRIDRQLAEAEAREELLREDNACDAELMVADEELEAELAVIRQKVKAQA